MTTRQIRTSEQTLLDLLNEPLTYKQIASELDITKSTARDHISGILTAGVPLGETRVDGSKAFYRSEDTVTALERERPTPATSKASHTKAKKDIINELKTWLADDLTGRAPVVGTDTPVRVGHEDMVCHRSDDHVGAYYKDENGILIYDDVIAAQRIRAISDNIFETKAAKERAGTTFDTLHIVLGGDGIHGEGIHDDQPWESCLTLVEQLSMYVDLYTEFIDRASREFPAVQVICQRGNHGEIRGDGFSPDANADDVAFMMLEKRIRDRGYDTVTLVRGNGHYYTNFRMRVKPEEDAATAESLDIDISELPPALQSGHRAHLRHGQNSLLHIGTSSGQNRWRGWNDKHAFDIAYRGHFHQFRIEKIDTRPVIMSSSICPPADYEESFAAYSEPGATVHGVSDEKPFTWFELIDFE